MTRLWRVRILAWAVAALVLPLAGCQEDHVPSSARASTDSPLPLEERRGGGAADSADPLDSAASVESTALADSAASPGSANGDSSNTVPAVAGEPAAQVEEPAEPQAASDAGTTQPTDPATIEPSAGEPATVDPAPVAAAEPAAPPADSGPTQDITFDTIKFDMEKEDPYDRALIGPKIEALSGKNIKIRGYILPASVFKQTGITGFVLVRDNMECCFGPGAALFDCIVVQMKPGKSTDFTVRPVAVEGTFKIEELENPVEPDGNPIAIYHLDGEGVE